MVPSGRQNALLGRKRALLNLKKTISGQLKDPSGHRMGITGRKATADINRVLSGRHWDISGGQKASRTNTRLCQTNRGTFKPKVFPFKKEKLIKEPLVSLKSPFSWPHRNISSQHEDLVGRNKALFDIKGPFQAGKGPSQSDKSLPGQQKADRGPYRQKEGLCRLKRALLRSIQGPFRSAQIPLRTKEGPL